MIKNPFPFAELVLTKIVVYGRKFDLPPGALSVSFTCGTGRNPGIYPGTCLLVQPLFYYVWYRPVKTVTYVQELSYFLVKCQFHCTWHWQKPWNMAKNCQASFFSLMWYWQCPWNISNNSLFNFSFATPGTGEDSGIWPIIVLLPYLVSVSLHPVLANPAEYGRELFCFLQCRFRYISGSGKDHGIYSRTGLHPCPASVSLHVALAKAAVHGWHRRSGCVFIHVPWSSTRGVG